MTNLTAIPSGIPETLQRLQNEGFVDFILEIFELSGISNVGNCYQQIKFSKYLKKRIIEDIRPTVHANTENTILHSKQSFFLKGYAFVHLRFNVFQINYISTVAQQLNMCLLYFKKHDHILDRISLQYAPNANDRKTQTKRTKNERTLDTNDRKNARYTKRTHDT